ncbi:LysR family transcriptional regulator [Streptomyces sp. NPDC021093]|uniref:LysR family transcriptional regulator n=1 Tax=Streptomyces sp. NPDC021093 TaxID=3365112 RepID=UPI0037B42AE3
MWGAEEDLPNLSGLLRRLEYFVAVADELHLGRAARRCQVTQPTLSHQMTVLEEELGAVLLSRSSRPMTLTPAGRTLREEAPRLLQHTYTVKERVRDVDAGRRSPVRVAFSRSGIALYQRQMVTEFSTRDAVPVSVESGWSERNLSLVRTGQVDFAFVRPPVDADDLRLSVVGETELVEVHPRTPGPTRNLSRAAGRAANSSPPQLPPLLLWPRALAPGLHDAILSIARRRGHPTKVAREEPDYVNLAAAVASGAGMTYMDRSIAEWASLSADLDIRPLGPPGPRTEIAVVWRDDQDEDLAARFVATCRRVGSACLTGHTHPDRSRPQGVPA